MNIVVTGGAGFIGSHIQDRLISLDHTVVIVDNLRSGKKENVHEKAVLYELDVRDRDGLVKLFNEFKPGAVFHLAAQNEVPYSMDHPDEDREMNITGMMNVLEASRPFKSKIIYSNTGGALFGDVPEDHLPVSEDEPIVRPSSFYGVSKGAAESYLKLYGNIYGLPFVSLRYANVYGPRQEGNREAGIVAIFTSRMLKDEIPTINGTGIHTRDYVFVDDVVDANIAALDHNQNDYFNIATGLRISNQEVFDTLAAILSVTQKPNYGPDRPGDTLHNALSPAKAEKLLNWKPKTSFSEGVRTTVEYYRSK